MNEDRHCFGSWTKRGERRESLQGTRTSVWVGEGNSPISVSFVGGQCSHKDPQEGSQDSRHPVKVMDAARVLNFEF